MGKDPLQPLWVLGREKDEGGARLGQGLEVGGPEAPDLPGKLGGDAYEHASS